MTLNFETVCRINILNMISLSKNILQNIDWRKKNCHFQFELLKNNFFWDWIELKQTFFKSKPQKVLQSHSTSQRFHISTQIALHTQKERANRGWKSLCIQFMLRQKAADCSKQIIWLLSSEKKCTDERDMKANDGRMNDGNFSTWIASWFLGLWFIFYRYPLGTTKGSRSVNSLKWSEGRGWWALRAFPPTASEPPPPLDELKAKKLGEVRTRQGKNGW